MTQVVMRQRLEGAGMSSLDASQTNVETLKSAELLSGLVSGLPAGLIFGLVVRPVTANTCSPAFAIASLWLGVQRRLPFHSIGFLDNAYRLGLLRIVGPCTSSDRCPAGPPRTAH